MFEGFLGYLVGGAVIGILARLLKPGADPMGWILTILLGVAGAWIGGWLSAELGVENRLLVWAIAILAAIVLLFVYEMVRGRHDAEGDQRPVVRRGKRLAHGSVECGFVRDHVVGRQDQQQRVVPTGHRLEGRRGDRRRRVAADRLEQDRGARCADLAQLLGHQEAVFLVGDHDGCRGGQRRDAAPGGLQHRVGAGQRQELLGIGLA